MTFEPTAIPGCLQVRSRLFEDERGSFLKLFTDPAFADAGLACDWQEVYTSTSRRGVIRGMHFQLPPADHDKLVFCLDGEVLDVVLDLRVGSPTERQAVAVTLTGAAGTGLFIPRGCAHGFLGVSETSSMLYLVTSAYAPEQDRGVRWDSFGFDWPTDRPIVSERDRDHPALADFASPFRFALP